MLNDAQLCLTGYVATQPVTKALTSGDRVLEMRVAWTPRWLDRQTGEWVDGTTSYITVICWRRLAANVGLCIRKGDPVAVRGRLSVRPYQDKQGQPRIAVEVDASSIGHDLNRGVADFQRVRPHTGLTAAEFEAAKVSDAADGSAAGDDGDGDLSLPPEPDDSFFNESAIGDALAGAELESVAAGAPS
jgi:single-strand DNA-binding protein